MNKNIDDNDRIVIGVREWAIHEVFQEGFGLDRWLASTIDASVVVEIAKELEKYVLGDIS